MLTGAVGNLKEPEPDVSIQMRKILNIPINKASINNGDHVLTHIFLQAKFHIKIIFNITYQCNLANKNTALEYILRDLQLRFA